MATITQKITPNLWFDDQAEEAARFYTSVFKNSKINEITRYGDAGPREAGMVMTVNFELDGVDFTAINGGPEFTFDEAVSFLVNCDDQAEIDYFWDALSEGGEEGPCGWLKDRFGLSWQVAPADWYEKFSEGNQEGIDRLMQAMFQMKKLDLQTLEDAYNGK